ncbi:MAG: sigma 54-interacting transcriptional regulator [Deltaproteobacteria bacterium]|nr:sigma 54-interacting transcriptional regulator [Deltaproteobacteria bacterium]
MAQPTIEDVSSIDSSESSSPAIVMIASGTTPHALGFAPVGVVQLGRHITSGDFTVEIDDERMSREHATVEWQAGGWRIVDLDSRNGTFLDGARLAGELHRAGDLVLRLGHTVFVLVRDGRGHLAPREDGAAVIGPELSRAYDAIRRNATQESDTLLLHGESGSGKELAARLYHDTRTPDGPFIAVNCATIPEGVAERLLFGSKRGAFSGAIDAVGYLQSAHGGTLFLDEIADLDPAVQAKLLRVLETRDVLPIGATSPVAVELGVVAASHRELRTAIVDKQFRDDLYYRLARVVIHLPPLRARKIDAARLAVRELAAVDRRLSAHAKLIEACCVRAWPGNIRELRGAVGQAASEALAGGRDVVKVTDLPPHAGMIAGVEPHSPQSPADPGAPTLDKTSVLAAIASADGVLSVAARTLGLHRTQLYRLMEKLGISREK